MDELVIKIQTQMFQAFERSPLDQRLCRYVVTATADVFSRPELVRGGSLSRASLSGVMVDVMDLCRRAKRGELVMDGACRVENKTQPLPLTLLWLRNVWWGVQVMKNSIVRFSKQY